MLARLRTATIVGIEAIRVDVEVEVVDTPKIDSQEVLIFVMAAGVNYNGVWAGLGLRLGVVLGRGLGVLALRFRAGVLRRGGGRLGAGVE